VEFDLESAQGILGRTPRILDAWLRDLPEPWTRLNEGEKTWSPFDVLGHLIHGEEADWIPRARVILQHGADQAFEPFDRFAQFRLSEGKSVPELLDRFALLRARSLSDLAAMNLTSELLDKEGRHPALGVVTLRQLLSTWVAHDLDHLVQVGRVMAKGYTEAVGPWRAYLGVLNRT